MLKFALAQLNSDVCLVQVTDASLSSALMVSDVKVFRHEFISIFRYSHSACLHPHDFRVLCTIDDDAVQHDPENDTVYLAKHVMTHLQSLVRAVKSPQVVPSRHRHSSATVRTSRVSAPAHATTRTARVAQPPTSHTVPIANRRVSFAGP